MLSSNEYRGIVLSSLIILALLILNVVPVTHQAIIDADHNMAVWANSMLQQQPQLAYNMGKLNTRISDVMIGSGISLVFLATGMFRRSPSEACGKVSYYFWVALLIITTYACSNLLAEVFPQAHPTCFDPELTNVQKLFGIKLRTSANESFPSGHAMAYALFTMLYFSKSPYLARGLAVFATIMLSMRLILGLHWLSDIVLGSLPLAFFVYSLATESPLSKTLPMLENLMVKAAIAINPKPFLPDAGHRNPLQNR